MDIFVGSLPFKINEKQLQELFQQYGEVTSVKIIINKATRQNKGFGFVVMPDEEQGKEAIKNLNGSEIMGRKLQVNKSLEKEGERKESTTGDKGVGSEKKYSWWKKPFSGPKKGIITYGDNDKEPGYKKETPSRAKAKNFKVGARKKK